MDDLFFSEDRLREKYSVACLLCADFARAGGKEDVTAQMINAAIDGIVNSEDNPVAYVGSTENITTN
jgi:hypothetical protein